MKQIQIFTFPVVTTFKSKAVPKAVQSSLLMSLFMLCVCLRGGGEKDTGGNRHSILAWGKQENWAGMNLEVRSLSGSPIRDGLGEQC